MFNYLKRFPNLITIQGLVNQSQKANCELPKRKPIERTQLNIYIKLN